MNHNILKRLYLFLIIVLLVLHCATSQQKACFLYKGQKEIARSIDVRKFHFETAGEVVDRRYSDSLGLTITVLGNSERFLMLEGTFEGDLPKIGDLVRVKYGDTIYRKKEVVDVTGQVVRIKIETITKD